MRDLLAARMLLAGLLALAIGSCAVRPAVRVSVRRQLGPVQWSRVFSGIGPTDAVTANAVRTAGDGLVLGGSLQGATDLGCGPLRSRGGPDGLVGVVAAADGACRWSAQIGGMGAQTVVTGVAADATGIYAAGWFNRTVTADGQTVANAGSTDGFLVKYDLAGTLIWALRFGGATADRALAVGLDGGAVVVTGWFTGTAAFGGPALTSAGQTDLFVAAYDPADGLPLWSLRAGGTGADEGRGLGGDWLVGRVGADGLVARFSAGALRWSQVVPAAVLTAVADGVVVGYQASGLPAPLVARYDPTGSLRWSHAYTAPAGAAFFGGDFRSVVLADGSIVVTGSITDPIDFGGGPLTAPYTADVALATFTADGNYRSALRIPAPFSDYGNGLDVTAAGPVLAGNAQAAAVLSQFAAAGGSLATASATSTATETATASPTRTATASPTATETPAPTATASVTVTTTATSTPIDTETATATATASKTPTARPTATDSPRPTDSAVPTATATATATETGVVLCICDVTRNGAITALDAARILQFIAGLTTLDDEQRLLADASGNAGVSTLDAALILRWVVGQPEAAPRCGRPLGEG